MANRCDKFWGVGWVLKLAYLGVLVPHLYAFVKTQRTVIPQKVNSTIIMP